MNKGGFFNSIIDMFIIFVIIGFLTAAIDYYRIKEGETPVLNISKFDEIKKIQTFRGIFYSAQRKVNASPNESLIESSNIKFSILIFDLDVPTDFKETPPEYKIETKEVKECQEMSKLYYADVNVKVYTYCLDDIKVTEKGKTKTLDKFLRSSTTILDEIDSRLSFLGVYNDSSTLMFKDFNNFSSNGLSMYKCNRTNVNDIYFAPQSVDFQPDFCTYKDDDFKFIFTIQEVPKVTEDSSPQKEVIFEDAQYRYEFDEVKSDRIFIVTPAVRGKNEMKYPLKQVISSNMLTMDELASKGLKFNKIDKIKEQESLANQNG